MRKILFLSGTRADYGKIKSLMKKVDDSPKLQLNIFVTGMHMLSKYGLTWKEIEKDGFENLYQFINQQSNSSMDIVLSNTILGLSNYVHEMKPDLILVHGDRLEALAGAIVGAFNNIRVAHIEGGEVSGTIDESIRHSITKLAHIHLVSNEEAKKRVVQLGENAESVFIIGSPDIDIMVSSNLPSLYDAKSRYDIDFPEYSLAMYHPVTTEVEYLHENVKNFVDALIESKRNYIVIYPNNDEGTEIILSEYKRFDNIDRIKVFPSIRFEYFLTLMRYSCFVIGNSSAGIREACVYGVPSIDIGNRQKNRYDLKRSKSILHVRENKSEILKGINCFKNMDTPPLSLFGDGKSDERFIKIFEDEKIWNLAIQKSFNDIE